MPKFQLLLDDDWRDFDPSEDESLKRAFLKGEDFVTFYARGHEYLCDFARMIQKNVGTGKEREIRAVHDGEVWCSMRLRDLSPGMLRDLGITPGDLESAALPDRSAIDGGGGRGRLAPGEVAPPDVRRGPMPEGPGRPGRPGSKGKPAAADVAPRDARGRAAPDRLDRFVEDPEAADAAARRTLADIRRAPAASPIYREAREESGLIDPSGRPPGRGGALSPVGGRRFWPAALGGAAYREVPTWEGGERCLRPPTAHHARGYRPATDSFSSPDAGGGRTTGMSAGTSSALVALACGGAAFVGSLLLLHRLTATSFQLPA